MANHSESIFDSRNPGVVRPGNIRTEVSNLDLANRWLYLSRRVLIATLEGKGPDDLPGLRDEVLACGSTTMGTNESRLRCMLKKPPEGPWDLNDEDRTAIQWAFDRIETLEQQLNERRTEQIEWLRRSNRGRDKVKSAIETLKESLQ